MIFLRGNTFYSLKTLLTKTIDDIKNIKKIMLISKDIFTIISLYQCFAIIGLILGTALLMFKTSFFKLQEKKKRILLNIMYWIIIEIIIYLSISLSSSIQPLFLFFISILMQWYFLRFNSHYISYHKSSPLVILMKFTSKFENNKLKIKNCIAPLRNEKGLKRLLSNVFIYLPTMVIMIIVLGYTGLFRALGFIAIPLFSSVIPIVILPVEVLPIPEFTYGFLFLAFMIYVPFGFFMITSEDKKGIFKVKKSYPEKIHFFLIAYAISLSYLLDLFLIQLFTSGSNNTQYLISINSLLTFNLSRLIKYPIIYIIYFGGIDFLMDRIYLNNK